MLAKRILLSNHPEILRPMEDSLVHRDGFSVLIANDGREAFEIIEEHDPALAILDLEMMELGGISAVGGSRATRSCVKRR